jgi:hypothetical protein
MAAGPRADAASRDDGKLKISLTAYCHRQAVEREAIKDL